MIESRFLREARQRRESREQDTGTEADEQLADFTELLMEALEIPEIRSAIAQAMVTHQKQDRVTVPPKLDQVSVRGRTHRRG